MSPSSLPKSQGPIPGGHDMTYSQVSDSTMGNSCVILSSPDRWLPPNPEGITSTCPCTSPCCLWYLASRMAPNVFHFLVFTPLCSFLHCCIRVSLWNQQDTAEVMIMSLLRLDYLKTALLPTLSPLLPPFPPSLPPLHPPPFPSSFPFSNDCFVLGCQVLEYFVTRQ